MSSVVSHQAAGGMMAIRKAAGTQGRARLQTGPGLLVLFFVLLFAVSLFYVWSHTQVVRATYALSDLQRRERELSAENERLRLEIATLKSPANLSRAAQEQLQMVPPAPGQIVLVK